LTNGGRFDCAVVGTCVADILVRPVPLSQPVGGGRLLHVDPVEVTTGGIVCNTGIGLVRLGLSVAAASLVGEDPWGGLIRHRLASEGLDTDALEADPALATSTTAVLIDPSGERSFAHHVGACAAIDLAWIRRHVPSLGRAEWVIIGYAGLLPGLEPDLAAAVAAIRAAGCRVALETGGAGGRLEDVAPALPSVDLYVPSLDEAAAQTGRDDPRAIVARYRELGAAGIVGVKLGSRGTLLSPAAGEIHEIPCVAAPGRVVDTTGAGDALVAGLVAGIVRGMPPTRACLLGAANAACCVTAAGATAGLRSFEETLMLADQVCGR
jgi:sugar/nucleoside kinase (ribokinase family)